MRASLFSLLTLISIQLSSQSIVEQYYKALENFDFKSAYEYVHENEKKFKPLQDFEKDHPMKVMNGFRMVYGSFFRFEILQREKEGVYAVVTLMMMNNRGDVFRRVNESMKKKSGKRGIEYTAEFVKDFAEENPDAGRMFKKDTLRVVEVDGHLIVG